jgi:hypothetical protein
MPAPLRQASHEIALFEGEGKVLLSLRPLASFAVLVAGCFLVGLVVFRTTSLGFNKPAAMLACNVFYFLCFAFCCNLFGVLISRALRYKISVTTDGLSLSPKWAKTFIRTHTIAPNLIKDATITPTANQVVIHTRNGKSPITVVIDDAENFVGVLKNLQSIGH